MLSVEEFARQNAESRKSTSFLLTPKAALPRNPTNWHYPQSNCWHGRRLLLLGEEQTHALLHSTLLNAHLANPKGRTNRGSGVPATHLHCWSGRRPAPWRRPRVLRSKVPGPSNMNLLKILGDKKRGRRKDNLSILSQTTTWLPTQGTQSFPNF